MTATRMRKPVDWSRWLHDPRHWERFYDGLGIKTYAAIARGIWDGARPEEAVDAAVESISHQMHNAGIPASLVRSYREDYFHHRDQLVEVACEIWDVLPAARRGGAEREPDWAGLPWALIFGAWGDGMAAMAAGLRHEAEEWSRLLGGPGESQGEHRHGPCPQAAEDAPLTAHYGRRTHDVDVERM